MSENSSPTAWTTGWLPNGAKVSFTIPVTLDGAFDTVLDFTNRLLAAGFLLAEPGVGDGEKQDMVGWVCRHVKIDDDGSETPVIDLYADHESVTHKIVRMYLNTPEDVRAFEAATGVKVNNLPLVETPGAIERAPNIPAAKKIIRLAQPVAAIHKANPNYEEGSKKLKRLFVRWGSVQPIAQPAASASKPDAAPAKADNVIEVEFVCDEVVIVDKDGKKHLRYQTPEGDEAFDFSRQLAKAAGYETDAWEKPGTYPLRPAARVKARKDNGRLRVAKIEMLDDVPF